MKIKDGFILRKVGRQYIVAATGEASKNFNGMMRLNEEAAFAFEILQKGATEEELAKALLERYAGEEAVVKADVAAFVEKLKEADAIV